MEHVKDIHAQHTLSKNNAVAKHIQSGATVRIETLDALNNQVTSEDTPIDSIDWKLVNPATGPIFVEGANPGDVLKVTIDKIELAEQGVLNVEPGGGVMGDKISEIEFKITPIRNNKAIFNSLEIPLNPMVGVIGVAPEQEDIPCSTPGPHGGNMDNKMIAEGATIYFPVFVEGALFSLGDLHAAMGDGEICYSGIEISGAVTVTIDVIKDTSLRQPLLENDNAVSTIASAPTMEEAVKITVEEMVDLIDKKSDMSVNEIIMLMSAVGETEICQIVNPLVTARFVVPKWVFQQLNIETI